MSKYGKKEYMNLYNTPGLKVRKSKERGRLIAPPKLTGWYTHGQLPLRERVGRYQCKLCLQFHYWNGINWKDIFGNTIADPISWRGLAEPPK